MNSNLLLAIVLVFLLVAWEAFAQAPSPLGHTPAGEVLCFVPLFGGG